MFPQAGARLCLRCQARKGIDQRTVFWRLLIKEGSDPAQRADGKGKDVKDKDKWKCNDPPQCLEKFSHLCLRRLGCRPQARSQRGEEWAEMRPTVFGWRQYGRWDQTGG